MVDVIIKDGNALNTFLKKEDKYNDGDLTEFKKARAELLVEKGFVEYTKQEKKRIQKKVKQAMEVKAIKEEAVKEYKAEELVEKYLEDENPIFERLGNVIHNNSFAYGTRVFDKADDCFCNAIVTDKREMFVDRMERKNIPKDKTLQIQHKFGVRYNSDFEDPDFPWTNEGIRKFIKGEIKDVDKREVYEKILELLDRGIIWSDQEKHRPKKIACKIIASYFPVIWANFERESQIGHSTGGKSTKDIVPYYLGCNTIKVATQSEADLYRSIDATFGWIFADNKDYDSEEQARATNKIIEYGFSKVGGYSRTRRNDKKTGRFDVEKKAISGFMNFTSVEDITNEKVASRNRIDISNNIAPIPQTEEEKKKFKYDYEKDDAFKKESNEMRNDLRVLALENWREVQKLYKELETPFAGRFEDGSRPMLTIAKWIGDDVYADVEEYYKEKQLALEMDMRELDNEFDFYETLSIVAHEWGSIKVPTKLLIDLWYSTHYGSSDDHMKQKLKYKSQKELPKALKSAVYFKRRSITNNATAWEFKLRDIEYLRLSRGYTTIEELKDKLKNTIGKIANLHNLHNKDNLGNIDNIDNKDLNFFHLEPFYKEIDSILKDFCFDADDWVATLDQLPELAKLPKIGTGDGKKKCEEKINPDESLLNFVQPEVESEFYG